MPVEKPTAALRKRQQIAKASQVMFLWVAIASVVVGAAAVLIYFLAQKAIFNEKILSKKGETATTLQANLDIVEDLQAEARTLNTSQILAKLRRSDKTEPVSVVFDALPDTPNSAALGASLQSNKLLDQVGISIESLAVTPISGVEDASDAGAQAPQDPTVAESGDKPIEFTFSVTGSRDALEALLKRLERSIRIFSLTSLDIEKQGEAYQLSVVGKGFYKPAIKVELRTEKWPQEKVKS